MVTVSLCMIVKNEEQTLPRCLASVAGLVDQIVIVDTGSTDRTREQAARFTGQIYDFPWIDDFAAARNFSFDQAEMDYCMWLDADDVLEEEDRRAFLRLKEELSPETDVVMMRYHTAFDAGGRPAFTYYRERLIRRGAGFRWQGAVHEAIPPAGVVVYSQVAVTHRKTGPGDPERNLRIFQSLLRSGKSLSPPGAVLLRPGADLSRPGPGGRGRAGGVFALGGGVAGEPAGGLPHAGRLLRPPGPARPGPGRPAGGAPPGSAQGGAVL